MSKVALYGSIVAVMLALAGITGAEPVPIALEEIETTGTVPLKLSVFECGAIKVSDMSMFDSHAEKGTAGEFVNTCCLIQHPKGTLMWDTGLSDSLAVLEGGQTILNGALQFFMSETLRAQLDEIGVDPAQVSQVPPAKPEA